MEELRERDMESKNQEAMEVKLTVQKRIRRAIGSRVDKNPVLVHLREVMWDRSDWNGRPTTTLLWLAKDRHKLNPWLDGIALIGIATAALVLIKGAANVPLILTLWLIQKSIMNVGGLWYGYGWEPQLAELSFHTMFLVPLFSMDPIPALPVSSLVQWTIKWHLFRIMIGAGLIKQGQETTNGKIGPSRITFMKLNRFRIPLHDICIGCPNYGINLKYWGTILSNLFLLGF
eukprot:scaffold34921_cov162-Amphora_coffeaeformis.AAC.6